MKERFKRKSSFVAPQGELGAADPINKVQQQLSAIEEKLDTLISLSSKRPFEKSYSQKPSPRFDRSHRYGRGREGNDSRERDYTWVTCADCNKECEIPFKPSGDRPVYCKECLLKRKRGSRFNTNRDSRSEERDFPRQRHFDKRQTEKRQKPVKVEKPFYARRKKRD